MKSLLIEIPDAKQELVDWLEPILVSGDLRQLVSELAVVSTHGKPSDLNVLMGGKLDLALQRGLVEVAEADLQRLLRHPYSLMELQQEILERGARHWLDLVETSNLIADEGALREGLARQIEQSELERASRNQVVTSTGSSMKREVGIPNAASSLRLFSMAAVLLLAVTAGFFVFANWPAPNTGTVAWGWASADDLSDLTPAEYLNKLARGADAWFNQRPVQRDDVRQRLLEFKAGCEKLIVADHAVLEADTKQWLVATLQRCLDDVNAQLTRLDSNDATAVKIRTDIDQVIRDVAAGLRNRASEI